MPVESGKKPPRVKDKNRIDAGAVAISAATPTLLATPLVREGGDASSACSGVSIALDVVIRPAGARLLACAGPARFVFRRPPHLLRLRAQPLGLSGPRRI